MGFIDSSMSDTEVLERASHGDLVYLKLSAGGTGSCADLGASCVRLQEIVALLRRERPDVFVAAGIGIQQSSQVAECRDLGVDMVVVGTLLMEKMQDSVECLTDCIDALRQATGTQPPLER